MSDGRTDAIPELLPTLPVEDGPLRIPRAHPYDEDTVTPDQVTGVLIAEINDNTSPEILSAARMFAQTIKSKFRPEIILGIDSSWGDVKTRALARIALDPKRNKPISLITAFDHELWLAGLRKPAGIGKGDRDFFTMASTLFR